MSTAGSYTTIVVGTDGSALADATVARAAVLAAPEGATLIIVCAFSALTQSDDARSLVGFGDTRLGEVLGRQAATDALSQATATATGLGVGVEKVVLAEGEPAAALLKAAQEHEAELIVLGAIRDVSIADRLLGTVASTVLRRASCDVLVVRPPGEWGEISDLEVPSSGS